MKNLLHAFTLSLLLSTALSVSCATQRRAMEGVKLQMNKTQVLEVAGNPKYTYRTDNQDHWVYLFANDQREWTRTITFDSGKVVKVGKAQTKDAGMKELENTSSLEEFEAKGRALQKAKPAAKFKNIDGSKGN